MKLTLTERWLRKRLERVDGLKAAAGGTTLADLKKEAQRRLVSPQTLAEAPTEVGKVVRFRREQRGWSRAELAAKADVPESEITAIETQANPTLQPRTVIYLANALDFSKTRFQQLAGHVKPREPRWEVREERARYAAYSTKMPSAEQDEFETICALVQVLSEKD